MYWLQLISWGTFNGATKPKCLPPSVGTYSFSGATKPKYSPLRRHTHFSNIPVQVIGVRGGFVDFGEDPRGVVVGGGEGFFEAGFVFFWDLHGMQGHVHVVFGHEGDAALGGELGFEAVA